MTNPVAKAKQGSAADATSKDAENGNGRPAEPTGRPPPSPPKAKKKAKAIDPRGYIYLGIMIFVGSTTAPFAQLAVRQLPVSLVPLLRFGFAAVCLAPFLKGAGASNVKRLIVEDWRRLSVVAACCVPINQWFFLNAARLGTNSHVGLFYATVPLVVWVLAWWLGHEPLDLGRLGGIVASIAGVLVIGLGNALGGEAWSPERAREVMISDILLVGAVISWGAYVALSRPLIIKHGALPVLAGTFLLGFALQIPIAALGVFQWPAMLRAATASAWISLAILALAITPLNLALQNLALKQLDASQVATFSNIAPVLTVVWGVSFFGEPLSPALLVGGLLTLGGVVWTSRPSAGVRPEPREA